MDGRKPSGPRVTCCRLSLPHVCFLVVLSDVPFIEIYLFFVFWLWWVLIAARGLSLVVAVEGYSSLQ